MEASISSSSPGVFATGTTGIHPQSEIGPQQQNLNDFGSKLKADLEQTDAELAFLRQELRSGEQRRAAIACALDVLSNKPVDDPGQSSY